MFYCRQALLIITIQKHWELYWCETCCTSKCIVRANASSLERSLGFERVRRTWPSPQQLPSNKFLTLFNLCMVLCYTFSKILYTNKKVDAYYFQVMLHSTELASLTSLSIACSCMHLTCNWTPVPLFPCTKPPIKNGMGFTSNTVWYHLSHFHIISYM